MTGSDIHSPITRGWKHMDTRLLPIQRWCMRLLIWLYTMSIHLIWYYRHVLVYLISIYTYIDSQRHVSHHHIICTHYYLLVAPHATYHGSLARQNFHNIVLHINGGWCWYWDICDHRFYINREIGWNEISGTLKFQLYR